jgi:ketosteroid isomerase-like protein
MGQARQVMDQLTAAVFGRDRDTLTRLYAEDAVAVTPDEGTITGRDAIVEYLFEFVGAFPDAKFEQLAGYEDGDVAIDEGVVVGTHTQPLQTPAGMVPPTGRQIHMRSCDVAVVRGDVVAEHRFYFDQMELLDQLGLIEQGPT